MWGSLSNEALTAQKSNTDDRGIFDSVKIATPDITEVFAGCSFCGKYSSYKLLTHRRAALCKHALKSVFLLRVLVGDRYFYINDVNTQVEFKSHQWFGATVRSHGNSILVRMGQGWSFCLDNVPPLCFVITCLHLYTTVDRCVSVCFECYCCTSLGTSCGFALCAVKTGSQKTSMNGSLCALKMQNEIKLNDYRTTLLLYILVLKILLPRKC